MEGFYMSANIIRLLPDEERALLECYVAGSQHPASFQQLFDTMEVPTDAVPDRLQIAVAQIRLHHVHDSLPHWDGMTNDGKLVTNRRRHKRHKDARLRFTPRLLFSINWATSGPGFEWPEAYHVTYVPGLEKYIFTASRDGADALGCEDHAIGAADRTDDSTGSEKGADLLLAASGRRMGSGAVGELHTRRVDRRSNGECLGRSCLALDKSLMPNSRSFSRRAAARARRCRRDKPG